MIIDGKQIASQILEDLKNRTDVLKEKNIVPHLHIITLTDNPESSSYIKQKLLKGEQIGATITVEKLEEDTSTDELVSRIDNLNKDESMHGIIVQRPMPSSIDEQRIASAVIPQKDVDGFHPGSNFETPVAKAVLRLIEEVVKKGDLKSKKIAVIGKGVTAGGPTIRLLKKKGLSPIVVDSKTENREEVLKNADIIVSAVGKKEVLGKNDLRKGAILIGVGLHMGDDNKLKGDFDEEEISQLASSYSPTPGGVGPVNVSMLMRNLVESAENSN